MDVSTVFKKRMSFSFEVFPPKMDQPMEPLLETLDHLYTFAPDFISCTYGAGGTNKGRNSEICASIKKSGKTEPVTHFTCVGNSREDVKNIMQEYVDLGITNVLALRGDLPAGWEGTRGDFAHADQLIGFIHKEFPQLNIACGACPEKHPDAPSVEQDIMHLRAKQDNGATFIMTQLCHDVDAFSRFMERIRRAGVTLPVDMGLMPVLKKDPIIRMTLSNGCSIPGELATIIGKYGDNPEDFAKAGKEYTVRQIARFIDAGIDGLHIYTLNKYADVAEILEMAGIQGSPVK